MAISLVYDHTYGYTYRLTGYGLLLSIAAEVIGAWRLSKEFSKIVMNCLTWPLYNDRARDTPLSGYTVQKVYSLSLAWGGLIEKRDSGRSSMRSFRMQPRPLGSH
jgi:hypothetical protein